MHNSSRYWSCTVLTSDASTYRSHTADHVTTHTRQRISPPCTQTMSHNINLILVDTVLLTDVMYDHVKECYITGRTPAPRWSRFRQSQRIYYDRIRSVSTDLIVTTNFAITIGTTMPCDYELCRFARIIIIRNISDCMTSNAIHHKLGRSYSWSIYSTSYRSCDTYIIKYSLTLLL